jgi:hypothetical protein
MELFVMTIEQFYTVFLILTVVAIPLVAVARAKPSTRVSPRASDAIWAAMSRGHDPFAKYLPPTTFR